MRPPIFADRANQMLDEILEIPTAVRNPDLVASIEAAVKQRHRSNPTRGFNYGVLEGPGVTNKPDSHGAD
jgi:hypothetical protein